MSACPDNRCDGSGFLYDDDGRTARPCSCRPRRVARKRAAAIAGRIPSRYREVSFERHPLPTIEREAPAVVREVRHYVRNISARIEAGQGIWFAGDVGTGKTTLAMLVSKAALEQDHTVAIYSLPRLLSMLRATYDESSRHSLLDLTDLMCSVDLLHIDDLGAEQHTPWVLEQLYNIVNTRYEDGRPLLLTTNLIGAADPPVTDPKTGEVKTDPLTGEVLREPRDAPLKRQIGERTVSRIYEVCGMPHCLYGADRRPRPDMQLPEPPDEDGEPLVRRRPQTSPEDDAFWEGSDSMPGYGRLGARSQRPLD